MYAMPRHRATLRYVLGPVTRSILMQRRHGQLDTTNPRVYAKLLRAAVETDRSLRDGLIPYHDRARRPR